MPAFMDITPIVGSLNDAQRAAVTAPLAPTLVLAGAGSGKTRVLTHRVAWLVQVENVSPHGILAVTFTNKAAGEMRSRIENMLATPSAPLWIGTFHGIAHRLLRIHWRDANLPQAFQIIDSEDQLRAIRKLLKSLDLDESRWIPKEIMWFINARKDEGLRAKHLKDDGDPTRRQFINLYAQYQEQCERNGVVDFAELQLRAFELWRDRPDVLAHYRSRFRHVLVDEFQDTNTIQYLWLKLLAGDGGVPFAVGDDDQSIYRWRGARVENLQQYRRDYPNVQLFRLEQNYRSTGNILRAANHVIAGNPKIFEKKLWSEYGDGEPVRLLECDGEEHEAERAVAWINAQRAQGGKDIQFADFAILYRANHQARIFEQALRRAQIPYKVSGGQSFFDRAEIKDLCAWLRLLVNQDDDPAFLRAVTTPKRGIGHTTLGKLGEFSGKWKVSLFEALFSQSLVAQLGAKALGSLHEFGRFVNELEHKARHTQGSEDAKALLLEWLKDIGYEQHLYDSEDSEKLAASRWSNVLDFVDWIAKRCGGVITQEGGTFESEKQTVLQVAQTISVIISLAERGDEQDQVTLSTLHASKGLEWPHVFLAGINEGLLPFKSEEEDMTPQRLEEERRLMYVGITRARTTLGVSTLRRRKKGRDTVQGIPSRFIAEMKLHEAQNKEDPKERLKRIRAGLAAKVAEAAAAPAQLKA
jgi:ATP-dependent DNA helicase Rep